MIGTLRRRRKQWELVAWTVCGAFFMGLLIAPLFARTMLFGWDGRVAAFIMNGGSLGGEERVDAGAESGGLTRSHGELRLDEEQPGSARGLPGAAEKTKEKLHSSITLPP